MSNVNDMNNHDNNNTNNNHTNTNKEVAAPHQANDVIATRLPTAFFAAVKRGFIPDRVMQVCIYIYIHIHTYVCIYIYISTNKQTNK